MNAQLLRRPGEGGKPSPVKPELLEATWQEFCEARERAMRSAAVKDGIRAGRAWGNFLRLFERA